MNANARRILIGIAGLLAFVWLAPSSYAMVPQPEPGPATPAPAAEVSTGGLAIWQILAIAAVAVAIGAVGATLAQRTRQHADVSSLTTT